MSKVMCLYLDDSGTRNPDRVSKRLGSPYRSGRSNQWLKVKNPARRCPHLSVMTELNKQGSYDRMTDDLFKLTGQKPISIARLRQVARR
jgi:hypothetical protein